MEGLQSQFIKTLSKFKVNEFPNVLDFVFGDALEWEEVKRTVQERKIPRRARSLAEVCCSLYQMTRPTKEDAFNTIWLLQLCEISLHSQCTWFGLKLTDPFPDSEPSWDDIEENLVKSYKNELRNAQVNTVVNGNLLYVMVVEEKTTKKSSKFLSPVFFVYDTELSSPYAFFTPKQSKTHPLDCFSAAVGYQNYSLLRLSGQDVNSLYGMVQRKMSGTVALRPPPFIHEPIESGYIRDLTGYLYREDYARKIMKGNTKLTKFTVQSCNEWRGTSVIPSLHENVQITSKLTIQTSSSGVTVEDVLRHLMVRGSITIPPPAWVQNLANRPRNEVTLHSVADASGDSTERHHHSSNFCSEEDEFMES